MTWFNDFWTAMWPVLAGGATLLLAFAMMFGFILAPVVALRVSWAIIGNGRRLARWDVSREEVREEIRRTTTPFEQDPTPHVPEVEASTDTPVNAEPVQPAVPEEVIAANGPTEDETQRVVEEMNYPDDAHPEPQPEPEPSGIREGPQPFIADDPNEPWKSFQKRYSEWRKVNKA